MDLFCISAKSYMMWTNMCQYAEAMLLFVNKNKNHGIFKSKIPII